ncbi:MAG: LptA/OstA family protein [Planctomycetota bacterium]
MDRAFRWSLRGALVLCLLAGLGLIVYAAFGGRPTPALRPGNGPGSGSRSGGTEPARPTESAGPGGTEEAEFKVREWQIPLVDKQTGRKEAVIEGAELVRNEAGLAEVLKPVAYIFGTQQGEGLDVTMGDVRGTAQQATVYQNENRMRLFGEVRAVGEDFEFSTEEIFYEVGRRALTSERPIEIKTLREGEDGRRVPEMVVRGTGLEVDVGSRKMTVRSDVVTRLHEVSRNFLSAGSGEDGRAQSPSDVVISSDGPMIYEHSAGRATFSENARAQYGGRTLSAHELTVLMSEADGKERVEVSDIIADGAVELTYRDQTASGDHMEWHNVIQSGTLTGEPCTVESPGLSIRGRKLTFYQMNDRFDAAGAGRLLWEPSVNGQEDSEPEDGGEEAGPMNLSADRPVRVQWTDSMSYDIAGRFASFSGGVKVQQGANDLSSDQLRIEFAENSDRIAAVVASGNVLVREAPAQSGREVRCDQFAWNAEEQITKLTAEEGKTVDLQEGGRTIASRQVVFDNRTGALRAPYPGRLRMEPAQAGGSGPITVKWQQSMRFVRGQEPVAYFQGAATAESKEQSIQADALQVEFGPEMEPARVLARGNALIEVQSAGRSLPDAGLTGAAEEAPDGRDREPGLWRLTADSVTIAPPQQTIQSGTPGRLDLIEGGSSSGSVRWQETMRMDSDRNEAVFEGTVEASLSEVRVNCDRLSLHFNEEGELRRTHAEGNVDFRSTGDKTWRLRSTSALGMFTSGRLRQFIARGEVALSDPDSTVNCRRLTLFLNEVEGEPEPVVTRAVAEKDVRVSYRKQEEIEASGDRLQWNRATDQYVLTGEPYAEIKRGGGATVAERIVLTRSSGDLIDKQ